MAMFDEINTEEHEDNISSEALFGSPDSLWLNELFSDKVKSLEIGNVINGNDSANINTGMKTPFLVNAMYEMWGKVPGNWASINSVIDIHNKQCHAFVYESVEQAKDEIIDIESFNCNFKSKESFIAKTIANNANTSFSDEELKYLSQCVLYFFVYISHNDVAYGNTNTCYNPNLRADTLMFLGGYKLNYETSVNGKLEFKRTEEKLILKCEFQEINLYSLYNTCPSKPSENH